MFTLTNVPVLMLQDTLRDDGLTVEQRIREIKGRLGGKDLCLH